MGCGIFSVGRQSTCDDIGVFSHQVSALSISGNKIQVFPRKHEIWAVYKNWKNEWSLSDLVDCEYELVEILDDSVSGFKVMALEKV